MITVALCPSLVPLVITSFRNGCRAASSSKILHTRQPLLPPQVSEYRLSRSVVPVRLCPTQPAQLSHLSTSGDEENPTTMGLTNIHQYISTWIYLWNGKNKYTPKCTEIWKQRGTWYNIPPLFSFHRLPSHQNSLEWLCVLSDLLGCFPASHEAGTQHDNSLCCTSSFFHLCLASHYPHPSDLLIIINKKYWSFSPSSEL